MKVLELLLVLLLSIYSVTSYRHLDSNTEVAISIDPDAADASECLTTASPIKCTTLTDALALSIGSGDTFTITLVTGWAIASTATIADGAGISIEKGTTITGTDAGAHTTLSAMSDDEGLF